MVVTCSPKTRISLTFDAIEGSVTLKDDRHIDRLATIPPSGLRIDGIAIDTTAIHLTVATTQLPAACPLCATATRVRCSGWTISPCAADSGMAR